MKKKIKKNEREMHPDQEFALRNDDIGVGSELQNNVSTIIDNIETSGISSVVVLLNTLSQGIKSTEFSPYAALQLWLYIQKQLTISGYAYSSIKITTAVKNISNILNTLSTKKNYTSSEIKTIETLNDTIIREMNILSNPQLSKKRY